MTSFINVADIPDPVTGLTDRQLNAAKTHTIPLDALVEVVCDPEYPSDLDGCRLYVVHQTRDCDETPLYCLGPKGERLPPGERFYPRGWHTGMPEHALEVVRLP